MGCCESFNYHSPKSCKLLNRKKQYTDDKQILVLIDSIVKPTKSTSIPQKPTILSDFKIHALKEAFNTSNCLALCETLSILRYQNQGLSINFFDIIFFNKVQEVDAKNSALYISNAHNCKHDSKICSCLELNGASNKIQNVSCSLDNMSFQDSSRDSLDHSLIKDNTNNRHLKTSEKAYRKAYTNTQESKSLAMQATELSQNCEDIWNKTYQAHNPDNPIEVAHDSKVKYKIALNLKDIVEVSTLHIDDKQTKQSPFIRSMRRKSVGSSKHKTKIRKLKSPVPFKARKATYLEALGKKFNHVFTSVINKDINLKSLQGTNPKNKINLRSQPSNQEYLKSNLVRLRKCKHDSYFLFSKNISHYTEGCYYT